MTYAADMYSWYAGSVDADVYFCPTLPLMLGLLGDFTRNHADALIENEMLCQQGIC
jgi:hypothetical protein